MGLRAWVRETFERTEVEEKPAATAPVLEPPSAKQARRAGFEYGIPLGHGGGSLETSRQVSASSERQQTLAQLHQLYMTCDWVSSAVDVVARTVTAGGLQVVSESDVPEGEQPADPPEVLRLKRLMKFCNPREDMIQLLRNVVTDLELFGDAYLEIVTLLGEPIALYTLDSTTMTVLSDEHGEVTGYHQNVDGVRTATFGPDEVIHFSLDAPRGGLYGVGPAQKVLFPATAWLFAMATLKECFRRGDPPRIHVDLGHFQDTDVQRWREQYMVNNLGPKAVGTPILTTGGGGVQVLDPHKVGDYLEACRSLRDEIVSAFGVPPSKVGIIETGNLGGGTGEQQDKTFRVNTIIPISAIILEKLNYHLLQVGFKIANYVLEFKEIDYRDSEVVEKIRDMRLRNGSYCVDMDTEILTSEGWKTNATLSVGDRVMTLNHGTGMSEWQECEQVCVFPAAEREMVRMRMRGHSSLTTTNHRWPVERYVPAKREYRRVWTTSETMTVWDIIPTAGRCVNLPVEAVHDDAFVELVAWFWTEGHAPLRNEFVLIHQKKPEGVERIRLALEKLFGPPYERSRYHRKMDRGAWIEQEKRADGLRRFRIAASHGHLFRAVVDDHVVSLDFLMQLTQHQLDLFIEVSLMADGNNATSGQKVLGQKRREAAERFQLACVLAGRSATLYTHMTGSGPVKDYQMWFVNVNVDSGLRMVRASRMKSSAVIERVVHDGIVWCPVTQNQSWMARRDGTVYFTGNTLNRYRDEIGEPPVDGGDDSVLVDRTHIVAWADMPAMSKATIAYFTAAMTAAGVNGYVPGVPDAEVPEPPAPLAGVHPAALVDPKAAPGDPKDASQGKAPSQGKDDQGKAPKETLEQRDQRRLSEAWQRAYRARRAQALRELPDKELVDA